VHCFTALEALREHAAAGLAEDVDVSVAVCFDHEEVGRRASYATL
jgi:aspartyl aminopeptidase